jgi:hypothetical protein
VEEVVWALQGAEVAGLHWAEKIFLHLGVPEEEGVVDQIVCYLPGTLGLLFVMSLLLLG